MKWLLGTYTSRFNRRHKLFGHLFSGMGPHHGGEERRKSEAGWAEKLVVVEEPRRWRLTEDDLEVRRKGDAKKVKKARRLRQETTMTLSWIAERLKMGRAGSLGNLLRNANG
jgi:hypothetical protein